MQILKIPHGGPDSRNEAGREHQREAPAYANVYCPNVILTVGRLTRFLFVCCGSGLGDITGWEIGRSD